ncbi:hypothetical protein JTE90_008030 [Oedothorax gibbosus]|uniref:THAP-type domain-containing protein n=1 Tax=Oedothorax gibbosus TaxID=931172 RepID=A0AAV6UY73_9ARAC|nr:hypothetical protein JTE90_008030 [Oedothorax gibbosus]
MVKSCSAYNCTNRHNAFDKHIKFFKFPSNPVKLKAWVRNIRRVDKKHKDWMPNKHSYICSVHFKPECMYTVKEGGRTRLKPDAVPTEFDFPSHFIKVIKERQTPRRTRRAPSPQQVPAVDISIDHNYGSKHVSELDKVKEQLKISQKQVTRTMDEMAIRKEIIFQGGTQTGFVDYGTDFSVELEAPAEWHCLTPN